MRPALDGVLTRHPKLQRTLLLLALSLGLAGIARAADDGTTCLRGSGDPNARLEACARYISSGKARGINLVGAYNVRASLLTDRGEFDRALEEVSEAIRLAPGIAQLRKDRGAIYWKMGEHDRALAELDEAIRLNPKLAETHYWRGLAYLSKRDYDRAIAEYTTAIKRDPKDAEFYIRRCEAYNGKGEFDQALTDCDEGVRRNPKFVWGYTWRGVTYENKGELDKARADYERALAINPTLEDARNRLFALSQRSAAQAQTGNDAAPATTPAGDAQPPPATAPAATPAGEAQLPATTPAATPAGDAQPPATAPEHGGVEVAAAPVQGGVRQVLEKYGMLGIWSVDCSNLASTSKAHSVYRVLDDLRVQREVIAGTERLAGIVESAVEVGPNELMITWLWETREVVRLRAEGNRLRHMELTRNGVKLVAGGIYTANSDRAGKTTSWANKCQAPPPAPGASAPGGARQVLEKYGVFGVWSADCSSPPSPNNAYVVYRALDENLVQYDVMSHPTERDWACIIESAADAGPNDVITTGTAQNRDVFRLHVAGNRGRQLELVHNGTKSVADGHYLENFGNPVLIGKETPWVDKCQ